MGCAQTPTLEGVCSAPERIGTLPAELAESSGLAASRTYPGILWSHNDSGHDAVLFALDTLGNVIGRTRVAGARNIDWEDITLAPCAQQTGDADTDCLYIADTGDNRLRRDDIAIYRVPEPDPRDTVTAPAERFPLHLPDGPRDIEALYILPGEDVHLVTKGRAHPIDVYRYPSPLRAGEGVEVERVQSLSQEPVQLPQHVTGAAASPDGRWVAIRSYTAVQLFTPTSSGHLTPALSEPGIDLMRLAEPQGEAVEILSDGTLYFTSESGPNGATGPLSRLRCPAIARP